MPDVCTIAEAPDFDFTIVTHGLLPNGAPDDILLANELRERNKSVRFATWDDKNIDWSLSPITIIRSTWDYFRQPLRWFDWINRARTATQIINDPKTLLWNSDKRYLLDLARAGLACVPTEFVEQSSKALDTISKRRGWMEMVVKPTIAAGAFETKLFSKDKIAEGQVHLDKLLLSGTAIVQPYLKEVETYKERSLVFIAGHFQHAFSKPAFSANVVGETTITAHDPSENEKTLGYAALAALPHGVTYARVDMVPTQHGPLIMELELIEPDLGLRLSAKSASLLADCLVNHHIDNANHGGVPNDPVA